MKIYELEKITTVDKNSSYIRSYPAMVEYFKNKKILTSNDVIVGAHMVYGWMPTIITIHENSDTISIEEATKTLNWIKHYPGTTEHIRRDELFHKELEQLKKKFNNSIVGVSKFLHFMRPDLFPIYDSRIHKYLSNFGGVINSTVNTVDNYMAAMKVMQSACWHVDFKDESLPDAIFHASVQEKIGYPISAMRAVELMMYLNSDYKHNQ